MPTGRSGFTRTAMSPSWPAGTSRASWSMTRTSNPGEGFPIEPGLKGMHWNMPTMATVSVWP